MHKHSSSSSATTTTRSGVESQTTLFNLYDVRLEIGTLVRQNKDKFFVAWEGPPTGLHFTIDPGNQKCIFCFSQSTSTPASSSSSNNRRKRARMCSDYKAEFLVLDITEFKHYKTMSLEILLRLASPPFIWKRGGTRNEFWNRTIDFSASGAIGRSDIYKLTIPPEYSTEWNKFINYLKQLRVKELDIILPIVIEREPSFGNPSSDPFYSIRPQKNAISFEVFFLVNAVLHKGIFNQHQLSEVFFDLLRCQPKPVNVATLNYLYSCSGGRPVVDACKRLRDVQERFLANPNASEDNKINKLDEVAYVRKLIITPTKAYCIPPEPEMPNRVLRQYKHESDRFLRVMFMDEGMKTVFYNVLKLSPKKETEVYSRFRSMLSDGFELCGRKYSFLAFSSNQLRDRSAWFFAECESIKIRDIHTWMGNFTHRNVAKCSARMGQCFSSTRATVGVPSNKFKMIPDIERNGYNFSDGIGKIAPDLAMEVAKRLNLVSDPPSAYQIRYAGFKGVIACWPSEEGDTCSQLYLRPSMQKFESDHTRLEICTWTRFQPGYLNRQIITLLSTLGVSDEVFWTMQQQMVTDLNRMLEDADAAFEVLTASCTEQGKTAAQMLSAGFKPQTEPHLRSMLNCIRASQLTGLREKSRIFVPSGRWLMGCLDELGVIEQGQCFVQVSEPLSLENCGGGAKQRQEKRLRRVIKGLVVVAKNPCLHPGDVRILEAVDAPGLHHLLDCLVFPQKGDRPHCNEASGSDLDGDTYFVTWDEHLMPPSKQSMKPMDFDNSKAKLLDRPVTNDDIVEFFVENMANESLGAICNAHVVHADLCEDGALNPKCLQLAELAARAVDLPKTGEIVTMPQGLKPKSYPDFMAKEEFMSYKSTKILGKLYRQITDDSMPLTCDSSYGSYYDIDLEIPGAEKFIVEAWELKCSYNLLLKSLMGKYSVTREVEVVTGHIWSMPKRISKKRGELQEQLKQSYNTLRKQFRKRFERIKGRENFKSLSDEMKSSLYEQKASAWYIVTYRPDMVRKSMNLKQGPDDDDSGLHQEEVTMLRSFPWIVTDYLARIKTRRSTR